MSQSQATTLLFRSMGTSYNIITYVTNITDPFCTLRCVIVALLMINMRIIAIIGYLYDKLCWHDYCLTAEIPIDCSTITTGNIIFPLSGGIMAGRTICLMHSRRSLSSIVADNHSPDIVCCHYVVGITRNRII